MGFVKKIRSLIRKDDMLESLENIDEDRSVEVNRLRELYFAQRANGDFNDCMGRWVLLVGDQPAQKFESEDAATDKGYEQAIDNGWKAVFVTRVGYNDTDRTLTIHIF